VVTKIAVAIIHVAEGHGAPIVRLWAHVSIMPLTIAQDTVAPLGAFLINMVSTVLLTLVTVMEPMLALASSMLQCMLVVLLLCYVADGGIIDEGGTDSTTITPCYSSSVAIVGTVVVMSLIMSPNGVINMATIICSG
jgi:hypothetical protein